MRRKGNHHHYENALEAYLIENNTPYIATNEGKKVLYNKGKIKNFDMVLPGREMLMVDLKGRSWSYKTVPKNNWENWVLKDDIESLKIWSSVSSSNQRAYFIYAYCCPDDGGELPPCFKGNTYYYKDRVYAFFAISIEDYINNSKQRSLKPPAVCVSRKLFATLVRPLSQLLEENKI